MNKRVAYKNNLKKLQRQRAPQEANTSPKLNLGFHDASLVVTREAQTIQIIIAGIGGIGAYLAQHVGRLMRVLYDDRKGVNLTLCDPDIVEEKNLGRQLFCDADLGEPKAVAYGQAWGLQTIAFVGEYNESLLLNFGGLRWRAVLGKASGCNYCEARNARDTRRAMNAIAQVGQ